MMMTRCATVLLGLGALAGVDGMRARRAPLQPSSAAGVGTTEPLFVSEYLPDRYELAQNLSRVEIEGWEHPSHAGRPGTPKTKGPEESHAPLPQRPGRQGFSNNEGERGAP